MSAKQAWGLVNTFARWISKPLALFWITIVYLFLFGGYAIACRLLVRFRPGSPRASVWEKSSVATSRSGMTFQS